MKTSPLVAPIFSTILCTISLFAQNKKVTNLVYVDKEGVLRFTKDKTEAAFFGVNYTVPFAYGYRSHKALNADIEKAIDADVYHFSRLGLDAFRVHVWDVEITDSLGNLLNNEHLRLFDYLISKLKERNIKTLITPIAFWGNGYPEKDEKTNGFSSVYGKGRSVVDEAPIKAQENYIRQLLQHVNPYTKLTYIQDESVVALEINNEPHHSGPKQKTTQYINRLANAAKATGWTKPIFYNISESPTYADAVAAANVNGHSFQWYPTGLVAGRTLQGNYLPNVDQYKIPFGDTIAAFNNRTKVVYEFDAGDVFQSNMYPAMARSFRTAGFQWATQFAYDPMATAYANTEYQTHYLNLAYTPSKAISLLIASKVFHSVPRNKSYGVYPADTAFDVFRVSYKNQLSEMNSEEAFYYSNTTSSQPVNVSKLKHIAGVGSSPLVSYQGTGAYFLDKISHGVWRLEVMPDAIQLSDPFAKASPQKPVMAIQWQTQPMQILLPGLVADFDVSPLSSGNGYKTRASGNSFLIQPGTYIISKNASDKDAYTKSQIEFAAPKSSISHVELIHAPCQEVTAGKPFTLVAKIIGLDTTASVQIEMRHSANKWKTISMQRKSAYDYSAEVPADITVPGLINYRIIIRKANNGYHVFPGDHKGDPYAWDAYTNETWETFVAAENSPVQLFYPLTDRSKLNVYNPDWRNNNIQYIAGNTPKQLVLKATINQSTGTNFMGWQTYIADRLKNRAGELTSLAKIELKGSADVPTKVKVTILTADAQAFSTIVTLTKNSINTIALSELKPDSMLLLPRPYPGFLPLWFKSNSTGQLNIADADKLEITFGYSSPSNGIGKPISIEIESVLLRRN